MYDLYQTRLADYVEEVPLGTNQKTKHIYSQRNGKVTGTHFNNVSQLRQQPVNNTASQRLWHYNKDTNTMNKSHARVYNPNISKHRVYSFKRKVETPAAEQKDVHNQIKFPLQIEEEDNYNNNYKNYTREPEFAPKSKDTVRSYRAVRSPTVQNRPSRRNQTTSPFQAAYRTQQGTQHSVVSQYNHGAQVSRATQHSRGDQISQASQYNRGAQWSRADVRENITQTTPEFKTMQTQTVNIKRKESIRHKTQHPYPFARPMYVMASNQPNNKNAPQVINLPANNGGGAVYVIDSDPPPQPYIIVV
jgi:hypothetical protein